MQPTGSKSSARTTVKSSSTPLAGAALSGNWMLFQRIYEMYERLTDHRWSREEVGRASSNQSRVEFRRSERVLFIVFNVQCEGSPQLCNFAVARTESA